MTEGGGLSDRVVKYRERLIDAAVLGVPLGLITTFGNFIQQSALGTPWKLLWVLVPLVVVTWFTYRFVQRDSSPLRHWRLALLFAVFSSLFAVLSVSDLLQWRTIAPSDREIATRAWMLPVRLGDWRYWFARRVPLDPNALVVVLLPAPTVATTADLRRSEAELVKVAQQAEGVIGIAFDVFFVDSSPADEALCSAIVASKVTVLSGYSRQVVDEQTYVELPAKPPLTCQQRDQQGHLLGFSDADGRVRAQQLWFHSNGDQPSLSMRVATEIQRRFHRSATLASTDNVVRYLPPSDRLPQFTLAQIASAPALLNNKFVLAGLDTPTDRFDTPFGMLPGTVIQAYAVHSLVTGMTITRAAPVWSALTVFAACYVLMLLVAQGRSKRFVLLAAGLIAALVVVAAALAMFVWYVWIEVVYCLAAIVLWVSILLVARGRLADAPPPAAAAGSDTK